MLLKVSINRMNTDIVYQMNVILSHGGSGGILRPAKTNYDFSAFHLALSEFSFYYFEDLLSFFLIPFTVIREKKNFKNSALSY